MIRDVAMSSIARVIFMVDWTPRVRRRPSRTSAPIRPGPASPRAAGQLSAAGVAGRAGLRLVRLGGRTADPLQCLLTLLVEGRRLRLLQQGPALRDSERRAEPLDGLPQRRLGVVRQRPLLGDGSQ